MGESQPHITLLPYDILLEIAECTPTADVLSLSLASLQMRSSLLPRLYRSVVLGSSAACIAALPMLTQHPHICGSVRELRVRPNYRLSWPVPDTAVDEAWVADQVAEIAKHLGGLHTFEWDGAQFPGNRLWMALRNSCRELKTLQCTTAFREFDARSHLFAFENLSAFTLCVRQNMDEPPSGKGWNFPAQLWQMLGRCPNLELLNISSSDASVQFVPIRDLANGRWPRLRSLTLTLMQYEVEHRMQALQTFLLAHPTIRQLAIHPRTWNRAPQHTIFTPAALPLLSSFVGGYYHLEQLPSPRAIQTLDLTYAPISHGVLERLVASLRSFVVLTSLDLRLNDGATPDELRDLSASCPGLVRLRLTFVEYAEIREWAIQGIARLLRSLPHLHAFSLDKRYLANDSTLRTALLLFQHAPALREINLRWTDQWCRHGLKEHGTFTVLDEPGAKFIDALERGLEIGGATFLRHSRHPAPGLSLRSGTEREWY
ncbi:hypothetical protein FB451DRAFT_1227891 [Mycena latifolia]|nr:hypothetical protein FB451DRAFT_1227891 [Mycena latifolia]